MDAADLADSGISADIDAGTSSPDSDAGTTNPGGDAGTTEPENDAGTTNPVSDAGTTEPENDAGTTEPVSDAGTTEPVSDAGQALDPFATEFLAAHNQVRATAQPTPQPALPALQWNAEAAAVAQAWADRCEYGHNPNRGDYGENIAASAPPRGLSPSWVVGQWASEAADYDYASGSCASGAVCGHYTQLVWRSTTSVGCATKVCTRNSPFGASFPEWQLWVCDYAPPGNYVGRKPY